MKYLLIAVLISGALSLTGCSLNAAGERAASTSVPTASAVTEAPAETASAAQKESSHAASGDDHQLGYVRSLSEENGVRYISVQYVQWLSGEDALKAIMEDDKCTREEAQSRFTNDHYIRFKNKDAVRIKVSDHAAYRIIRTGTEATLSDAGEVKKALSETMVGILCDITVKHSEVTELKQRYQP